MNSMQFMDKQIMGMPGSPKDDFFDLLNHPQEDQSKSTVGGGFKNELKEEILPSYDFQPIRPVSASRSINLEETNNVGGTRTWNSADAKGNSSNLRTYGSLDAVESANKEKDQNAYSAITVSEIDRTMKKHADNLLHALEGVGARLSQLETRTRHLEISVDALKVDLGHDNGKTDGKLRQMENILREVQTGVQVLRDKQEITEAQIQLSKLQASKGDRQSENQKSTSQMDTVQQPVPQQPHQPLPGPIALPQPSQQQPSALPSSNALPPPTRQNPPPIQLSIQLPPNQIPSVPQQEPYFTPSGPLPEAAHQQYQLPPAQQPHLPPPPAPHQPYQSAPHLPQYSQPPQPAQQNQPVSPVNPSQLQPSLSRHHPEENPQLPPHSYPPSVRQPPSMTLPHSGPPPSPHFYGATPHMYEPPSSRPSSGFSSGYVPPAGSNFNDSNYSGSPHYGSSSMKPHHFSSSTPSSGGSSYPRLPTAQLLPHALLTASSESGPSSGGTGNRVPIDDVVDKVAMMGFSRDQVRATVRKLTENGQSVDLNMVLDKLMNDGDVQPQKGWFSRGSGI